MKKDWLVYKRNPTMYDNNKFYACTEQGMDLFNAHIAKREIIKENLSEKEATTFRDILNKFK